MKAIVGAMIWIGLLLSAGIAWQSAEVRPTQPLAQIGEFLTRPRYQVTLKFSPPQWVAVGDPIYSDDPNLLSPIGRIIDVGSENPNDWILEYTDTAVAEIYGNAPELDASLLVSFYETPVSLEWVIATMLPKSKRDEIAALIVEGLKDHKEDLWNDLQPIIADVLRQSQTVIQQDLRAALADREEAFSAIASKYRTEFIDRQLVPVFQREVWPIIMEESGPLLDEVGAELWSQASVWRLTWRYLYDVSPLPEQNLTRKEFSRFVQDKAIPILQGYLPAFLNVQERVFHRAADNPEVAEVFRAGLSKISRDQEVKMLLAEIFQEVFVDNERLKDVWISTWQGPAMRSLLDDANARLGPTITQIGEAMFGNPRKQITPEFSEVLRSRVLMKDSRWLVVHSATRLPPDQTPQEKGGSLTLTVVTGEPGARRPFHIPSKPR